MNPPAPRQAPGEFAPVESWMTHNLPARHRFGKIGRRVFLASTLFGLAALALLLISVIDEAFGYTALEYRRDPALLAPAGETLDSLPAEALAQIVRENLSANRVRTLERAAPLAERSRLDLYDLVIAEVAEPQVRHSWGLSDSLLHADAIRAEAAEEYPQARLEFSSWLQTRFLSAPQSSDPLVAGVRTAILGSLWVILIAMLAALPTGIGAAIYLQEYAEDNGLNRLIQTNINNLAGVPSIIYGMLGLAIFVRSIGALTSGALFGYTGADPNNGRTILSAGLTMALLILPVIIITAQEAIRAVPGSLRQAAYGVGATRWQVVWHHVLPNAIPGILTGAILAMSRAFGETAPLVIVGASTYITFDPDGVFSRFTTLPIQIYQWTSRPQDEFRNLAAAAILALLGMLLALNAVAVLFRNRYHRSL